MLNYDGQMKAFFVVKKPGVELVYLGEERICLTTTFLTINGYLVMKAMVYEPESQNHRKMIDLAKHLFTNTDEKIHEDWSGIF